MKETTRRGSGKRLLSAFAVTLVAGGALFGAPLAANAAEEEVTDGSLTWGIREAWRNYIGVGPGTPGPGAEGEMTSTDGATTTEVGMTTWGTGTGTVDVEAGTGTIDYQGLLTLRGHPGESYSGGWGMTQTYKDPQITLTSPTTATLSFEMTQTSAIASWPALPSDENPGPRYEIVNLTFDEGDLVDGEVTTTSATLNETGAYIWNNYGAYVPGLEMDPVTFSFEVAEAEAVATTTTVAASATTAEVGDEVTLTATVAPAEAAGTVAFSANGAQLGEPVAVANGTASLATTELPAGENAITASFTPTDAAAFAASTSADAVTVTVSEPAVSDTATETVLTSTPSGHAPVGEDVTFTAQVFVGSEDEPVAGATAEGSVEFFDGDTSLGTVTLTDGTGSVTVSDLALGAHTVTAVYTSTNNLDASEASVGRTGHYGVVDLTEPELCTPAEGAETYTGVSATWAWNAYSTQWLKYANGNVKVDGDNFVLSEGVATRSADCTTVAFTGTLRVEAYNSYFPEHGQWVELVDPILVVDAQGNGAWTAEVRSGEATLDGAETSERIAVVEVASVDGLDFAAGEVNATVEFSYDNNTVSGSWAADYDSAWADGFIWNVPESIRSFYYDSGASGDVNKPASPLTIAWAEPEPTLTVTPNKASTADSKSGFVISGTNWVPGEEVSFSMKLPSGKTETLASVEVEADGTFAKEVTWATFNSVTGELIADNQEFPAGTYTVTATQGEESVSASFEVTDGKVTVSPTTIDEKKNGLATTGANDFLLAAAIASVMLLAGAGVLAARRKSSVMDD